MQLFLIKLIQSRPRQWHLLNGDNNENTMESFRIKINPATILSMAISNAIPQLAIQLPLQLVVVGHKIPPEPMLQQQCHAIILILINLVPLLTMAPTKWIQKKISWSHLESKLIQHLSCPWPLVLQFVNLPLSCRCCWSW